MKRLLLSQDKIVGALQENRYLSGLDDKILEFQAENTQLIIFEAEEIIIREGQLSVIKVEIITTTWLSNPSKPNMINNKPATKRIPNPVV